MNQTQAIHQQIMALLKARNYLLNQTPSDMIAITDVNEKIISLNARQSALSSNINIPVLSDKQEQQLTSAIHDLDTQIRDSKAASDILAGATVIINAVK